eukprot:2626809-Amphidinium_carterae.1
MGALSEFVSTKGVALVQAVQAACPGLAGQLAHMQAIPSRSSCITMWLPAQGSEKLAQGVAYASSHASNLGQNIEREWKALHEVV